MPRVSDRFVNELRQSHQIAVFVMVKGVNQEEVRLPVVDGNVTVDRTAATRRACSVRCVDPHGDLTPTEAGSLLTPYGTEIRPFRGVVFPDGTEEVHPLGVFRIAKASIADTTGGSPEISIESFDFSRTVARDKFVEPHVIDEGTSIIQAIKEIVELTIPDAEYDLTGDEERATTSPLFYDAGADPWEAVTELAASLGSEIYFDTVGTVVIAPPTDIDALPSPEFTYVEGQGCTMLDLDQVYSDEKAFNGVIVTGESPGDELPPARGEAWDEEPTSPTYRFSPYGEVPVFHSDNLIKTDEEAQDVAEQMLRGFLGVSTQLSLTSTVHPALEAGDVVEVRRARSHVSGLFAVDAFNVPLDKAGTQQLSVRQKRVITE